MKKLILFLLLPLFSLAQTSIKEADIYAAAGNRYEWLLTNVEGGQNFPAVSSLLWKMGMGKDDEYYKGKQTKIDQRWKYVDRIVSGNEKPNEVYVYWTGKDIKGYDYPITTKVVLEGNTEAIINFYINFWTRAINFKDTKPGETVTTRFLTDVAALTVGNNGKSKIVVQTAEDYYKK